MKKISVEILLNLFGVFIAVTFIPHVIIRFSGELRSKDIYNSNIFVIGTFLTAAIALILYALTMNYLIVRRVKTLSAATKTIKKGNYGVHVPVKGKDELSELIANFNLMTDELQRNEYLSKEFVRNFSHEIKTPVSAIKGYAQLIKTGNLNPEELKEYIDIIISESNRISALSKSMLLLSLIDSTVIVKQEEEFNLASQIRSILQMMQLEWERKGIAFDLNIDEIELKANKEWLYQVFQNLIDNAVKYSKDKGLVEISLKKEGNEIRFIIKDYGTGMSDEDMEKMFHLFYVGDKSRFKTSNGVGLYIVKKIIEKLKGSISVQSKLNEYTQITVVFPVN